MNIYRDDTVLFIGDSITFHCRDTIYPGHLGGGYVQAVAMRLHAALASPALTVFNRGISGDRIADIEARLNHDAIALKPSVVSILIGINDTLMRYSRGVESPIPSFADAYRRVLARLRAAGVRDIIILEPFLLPLDDAQRRMREDLDPRIAAIRAIAIESACAYVPLDGLFAEAAVRAPARYWVGDGVHPCAVSGDALIADAWMARATPVAAPRPTA